MPRIYVACLAAYNAGRLHGRWIDAAQDAEDIRAEIAAMLSESPEPHAEEWAIHDFEGFGDYRLSESENLDDVAEIAAKIEEHGDAYLAALALSADREEADRLFQEYRGHWDTPEEFAQELVEELGYIPKDFPAWIHIDWTHTARELLYDMEEYDGHYFWRS